MSGLRTPSQWFGFDTSGLSHDLFAAWRGMANWPWLAWLWPKLLVRLWLPTRAMALCQDPQKPYLKASSKSKTARYEAVLLPEHLILRHVVSLPQLQSHDVMAALRLQVSGLSPFMPDDLVWCHELSPSGQTTGNVVQVQLVMVSRKLVTAYLLQTHPEVNAADAEIWAPSAMASGNLVLPGFGEAKRLRHGNAWRWANVVLIFVVLLLVLAMAATPTAQLYLRANQAYAQWATLQKKAAPVLLQRESLVRTTEQLNNLAVLVGKPVPPLQVLKVITDALPDDTSLLSLQIQGLKVSLSGQTSNAAALMKQLGISPGLRDVTAPMPATKPLGAKRETFTIEFTLDPAQWAAVP